MPPNFIVKCSMVPLSALCADVVFSMEKTTGRIISVMLLSDRPRRSLDFDSLRGAQPLRRRCHRITWVEISEHRPYERSEITLPEISFPPFSLRFHGTMYAGKLFPTCPLFASAAAQGQIHLTGYGAKDRIHRHEGVSFPSCPMPVCPGGCVLFGGKLWKICLLF